MSPIGHPHVHHVPGADDGLGRVRAGVGSHCQPATGVAVSFTAVPWSYCAWLGALATLPLPTVVTFSA